MNCPHENTRLYYETTICLDCGEEWPCVDLDEDIITLDEEYGCDPWADD